MFSQNKNYNAKNCFTIVFYNVENLFDTINNPTTNDKEFLPNGKKKWNSKRYYKKLNDISKVLASINKNELPEIIGLCEIENKTNLMDLIKQTPLKNANYGIVHQESPDFRGIDVGLLYRKDEFKYIKHEILKIEFDFDKKIKTRDILYVKGMTNKEIFHIFVNHWSSRRGGKAKSEAKRIYSAKVLKSRIDKILKKNKKAKIVILGDFNDEPCDKSINKILNASNNHKNTNFDELYNLMYDKHLNSLGTYSYKGKWNMLDNIIVSKTLLHSKKGYNVSIDGGQIFSERWILYDNPKIGSYTPSRTYGGRNYYGGISDHLPVFVILKK